VLNRQRKTKSQKSNKRKKKKREGERDRERKKATPQPFQDFNELLSTTSVRVQEERKFHLDMFEPTLIGLNQDDKRAKPKTPNISEVTIENQPTFYGTMTFESQSPKLKDDHLRQGWWYKVYTVWVKLIC